MCDEYAIPYPKTVVAAGPMDEASPARGGAGLCLPIIVKPSSSILYWKHPFDGMKKVYTAQSPAEAASILKTIYAAGYPDRVILQDRIPGYTYIYSCTC